MKTFTIYTKDGRITVRVRHIAMAELREDGELRLTLLPKAGGGTLVGTLTDKEEREALYRILVLGMQEE